MVMMQVSIILKRKKKLPNKNIKIYFVDKLESSTIEDSFLYTLEAEVI